MDRASGGVTASPRFQRRPKTHIVKHSNRSEYYQQGNRDMAENLKITNQPLPPHAQLIQMATAHWVSHIVYVAAKLNLADHLAKGPQSADTLAGPTGTHAPSLYRLMRTLASLGILTEDVSHRFALTPLGDALRTGAPGSARATILTLANETWVQGFTQLLYSVQTGKSGYEKLLGMPIFDWLGEAS